MELRELEFRTLQGTLIPDVISYLNEKIIDDTEVLVGCDSQNTGHSTIYGLVIALHYGNRGGHIIYSKLEFPKIRDRFSKLWKEVELSVGLAESMKENKIKRIDYLDLDLNPDPIYNSNKVLASAMGWCQALGYNVRCKPDAMVASYVADRICRKVKYKWRGKKYNKKEKSLV